MKYQFAVLAIFGVYLGGCPAGMSPLAAQAKLPIYMIEDNTVLDPKGFAAEFAPLARDSVKAYGGRYLAGGRGVSIDGEPPKGRVVLLRWDSIEQMMKWRNSPEYKQARIVGEKYGKFRIIAVEGAPE